MGKGGGGSTTQTQKTEPWSGQQPFYKQIFAETQSLYDQGDLAPKAYQGQTIAGMTPEQLEAQSLIKNKAADTALVDNALALNKDILSGKYLDITQNPGFSQGLQDIKDAYSTGTAAQTDAAFANSGAYGGSAYQEMVGRNQKSYGDALTRFAGDMYNAERTRQQQALGFAPVLNAAKYGDANQLYNVGAQNQALQQAQINSDIEKFNIDQQAPISALQYYQGLIGGNLGGTTTSTTPYYTNPLGQGLGLGLGAAGLFAGGPFSAASGIAGLFS